MYLLMPRASWEQAPCITHFSFPVTDTMSNLIVSPLVNAELLRLNLKMNFVKIPISIFLMAFSVVMHRNLKCIGRNSWEKLNVL